MRNYFATDRKIGFGAFAVLISAVLAFAGTPSKAATVDGSTTISTAVEDIIVVTTTGTLTLEPTGSITPVPLLPVNLRPTVVVQGTYIGNGGSVTGSDYPAAVAEPALVIQGDGEGTINNGTYTGGDGNIGGFGVRVIGSGSELTMNGGLVQGGQGNAGGIGMQILTGSTVTLNGGTVQGTQTFNNANGVDAIDLQGGGSLVVDGASVLGSDGRFSGGEGIRAITGSSVEIRSGLVQGGTKTETGGLLDDGDALFMSGGTVNISGGTLNGDVLLQSGVMGSVSGGTFNDLFMLNLNNMVDISGGVFSGGLFVANNSKSNVSGGSFADPITLNVNSALEVSGGLFGGSFSVLNDSVLTFKGTDLKITNDRLTGFLLDGSWIDTMVTADTGGIIKLDGTAIVPLPPSFGFLVTAFTGMAAVGLGRRRHLAV